MASPSFDELERPDALLGLPARDLVEEKAASPSTRQHIGQPRAVDTHGISEGPYVALARPITLPGLPNSMRSPRRSQSRSSTREANSTSQGTSLRSITAHSPSCVASPMLVDVRATIS